MEESAPALVSTSTLCPASTSDFTPEGTMPTRDSWSLTSLGTPIIMQISVIPHYQSARAGAGQNNQRRWISTGYKNQWRRFHLRDVHFRWPWLRQMADAPPPRS